MRSTKFSVQSRVGHRPCPKALQDSQEACGRLSAELESMKKESAPNLRRLAEMEAT